MTRLRFWLLLAFGLIDESERETLRAKGVVR